MADNNMVKVTPAARNTIKDPVGSCPKRLQEFSYDAFTISPELAILDRQLNWHTHVH